MNNLISICFSLVLLLSITFCCGTEEVMNEEGKYLDGEKHGKWTSYCEHGNIIEEGKYLNGEKHGKWTTYFDDGQIWYEGKYKDGKKSGDFIFYGYGNYNTLHKVYLENHKDGKLDGELIHYHINGEIGRVENYIDGIQNGTDIFYDKDGKIYWSGNYKDDVLIDGDFIKSNKPFNLY